MDSVFHEIPALLNFLPWKLNIDSSQMFPCQCKRSELLSIWCFCICNLYCGLLEQSCVLTEKHKCWIVTSKRSDLTKIIRIEQSGLWCVCHYCQKVAKNANRNASSKTNQDCPGGFVFSLSVHNGDAASWSMFFLQMKAWQRRENEAFNFNCCHSPKNHVLE